MEDRHNQGSLAGTLSAVGSPGGYGASVMTSLAPMAEPGSCFERVEGGVNTALGAAVSPHVTVDDVTSSTNTFASVVPVHPSSNMGRPCSHNYFPMLLLRASHVQSSALEKTQAITKVNMRAIFIRFLKHEASEDIAQGLARLSKERRRVHNQCTYKRRKKGTSQSKTRLKRTGAVQETCLLDSKALQDSFRKFIVDLKADKVKGNEKRSKAKPAALPESGGISIANEALLTGQTSVMATEEEPMVPTDLEGLVTDDDLNHHMEQAGMLDLADIATLTEELDWLRGDDVTVPDD
eukprot:m.34742 g.34742  ORF g.34742 m.34742 type:complete len:294 (+) comp12337_c0_seq1:111-992(+)